MAKTNSNNLKKSIKSNKNKKNILKKLDFKKNWKKLSYLGLAGFLALSSIGYGGWKLYEQESASAFYYRPTYAGAYTFYRCAIPQWGTYTVYAYYTGPQGGVHIAIDKNASGSSSDTVYVSGPRIVGSKRVSYVPYGSGRALPNCNTNRSLI